MYYPSPFCLLSFFAVTWETVESLLCLLLSRVPHPSALRAGALWYPGQNQSRKFWLLSERLGLGWSPWLLRRRSKETPAQDWLPRDCVVFSLFPAPPPCLAFLPSRLSEEQSRETELKAGAWSSFSPVISQFYWVSPGLETSLQTYIDVLPRWTCQFLFLLDLVLGNKGKSTLSHWNAFFSTPPTSTNDHLENNNVQISCPPPDIFPEVE